MINVHRWSTLVSRHIVDQKQRRSAIIRKARFHLVALMIHWLLIRCISSAVDTRMYPRGYSWLASSEEVSAPLHPGASLVLSFALPSCSFLELLSQHHSLHHKPHRAQGSMVLSSGTVCFRLRLVSKSQSVFSFPAIYTIPLLHAKFVLQTTLSA